MVDKMRAQNYKDLEVWKLSMALVDMVYKYTSKFPAKEQFTLTAQMCRSAISIPSNIAEGSGRTGKKEMAHHLSIAKGSLYELETQAMIAFRRGYINSEELKILEVQCVSIAKMMTRFIQSLQT